MHRRAHVFQGYRTERHRMVDIARPDHDASSGRSKRRADVGSGVEKTHPPRRMQLALVGILRFGFLGGRGSFRISDQLLDLLPALVADLLVEIRAVLFLDDAPAFLPNRFVELRTVTLARGLAALAADRFIEAGAVAIADGVAALFASFPDGHLALNLGNFRRFGRFCCFRHWLLRAIYGGAFHLLTTFLTDLLIRRWTILGFGGLAAFAADRFVELRAVFRFHAVAATFTGLANAHTARVRVVAGCH